MLFHKTIMLINEGCKMYVINMFNFKNNFTLLTKSMKDKLRQIKIPTYKLIHLYDIVF